LSKRKLQQSGYRPLELPASVRGSDVPVTRLLLQFLDVPGMTYGKPRQFVHQLAERLDVHADTLRHAIRRLVNTGELVVRHGGAGNRYVVMVYIPGRRGLRDALREAYRSLE
jgi:hypothetical protein